MLGKGTMAGFIPTRDASKARRFYEDVLGFSVVSDNEYVMTLRSGTETILLQKVSDFKPLGRTILGWEVRGIRDVVIALAQRGAEFMRVEWMEQDELGIWTSPDGKVAWFKDPDCNTLSVAEH